MKDKLEKYRIYLESQELAQGTIGIYMRYAMEIEKYARSDGLTKQTVLAYKQKLKQRGMAPTTQNLAVIAVNKYLRYAGHEECTVKTEKLQRVRSLENVITRNEYRRMLETAKESKKLKYYYIMRTLAQTGIRVSELRYFTVEGLNIKKITVSNKGKTREIYLPDRLTQELKEYCEKEAIVEGVIFLGNTGKPIGRASVYKMLVRIGHDACVLKEKIYPHSFRHLFAVTYMEHYGNLPELADILGHSNLETTRIYTMSTAEEKRKKLDVLGL